MQSVWECKSRTNDRQEWTSFGCKATVTRGIDGVWVCVLTRLDGPPLEGRGSRAGTAFQSARQALGRARGTIRVGRPRIHGTAHRVSVPCSEMEYATWVEKAEAEGVPLAEWCREKLNS